MLRNTPNDIKTLGYVLRRTNYGEADRILNLITREGKVSVIAKGVRKPKSKIAGKIELFCLSEFNLHFGKNDMGVLTGARMIKFYAEILKDLSKMELATEILKKISVASENLESTAFFEIVDCSLSAINDGCSLDLVEAWFIFNLKKVSGEQINLYFDVDGTKLVPDAFYDWDGNEMGLRPNERGLIDANMIKIMRLMYTTDISVVRRIKNIDKYLPEILEISKMF